MDCKYNPSAYAKTGYQAFFWEKEKGENETWVLVKDTSKITEYGLRGIKLPVRGELVEPWTVTLRQAQGERNSKVKLIYPPSTHVLGLLFQPEVGCIPISQLLGHRF